MFGIGMPEMLLILAIALIVIGPNKLPDLAKSLGRAIGEFRRATSEIKETLEIDKELADVQRTFEDLQGDIKENIYAQDGYDTSNIDITDPADAKTAGSEPEAEDKEDA